MNVKYIILFIIIDSVYGNLRQKRHLRFPKGAAFTITVAITTFLPKNVPNGFGHIIEFDYGYPFPEKVALDRPKVKPTTTTTTTTPQPSYIYYEPHPHFLITDRQPRSKKSKVDTEKQIILTKLQEIITSFGYDGHECSIRLQCELQRLSPNRSMLEDLFLVLFSPSTYIHQISCENSIKTCPISIIHMILNSEKVTNQELFF